MPSQPPSIENFRNLESLDFSNNSFNGEIPTELISLSFLAYLNLSNNHLVVEIPKGTRIQSFEADSFKGNEELCGPPLTHNCSNDRVPTLETTHSQTENEILHRIIPQLDFAYEHHQGKKYMTRVQVIVLMQHKVCSLGQTCLLLVSDLVGQGGVLTDVPAVTSGFEESSSSSCLITLTMSSTPMPPIGGMSSVAASCAIMEGVLVLQLSVWGWIGVLCDKKGHVTALDLHREPISGGFDDSSKLSFADNDFIYGIPSTFSKLKNLTYLNLPEAGFVWQILTEISKLTRSFFLS
ncbi:hypothetical protein JHK86_001420 [Glycine max]|nr:hypothetical protein JHK86_001420 [Glycine max]